MQPRLGCLLLMFALGIAMPPPAKRRKAIHFTQQPTAMPTTSGAELPACTDWSDEAFQAILPTFVHSYPISKSFLTGCREISLEQVEGCATLTFDGQYLNPTNWLQSLYFVYFIPLPAELNEIQINYLPFNKYSIIFFQQLFTRYSKSLAKVEFKYCSFQSAAVIDWNFSSFSRLREFRMIDCTIDDANFIRIFYGLPIGLQVLELIGSKNYALWIITVIYKLPNLTELTLQNCALKPETLAYLFALVVQLRQLVKLNLSQNPIGTQFLQQLANYAPLWTHLNLSSSLLGGKCKKRFDFFAIYANLRNLRMLTSLDLSNNSIDVDYVGFAEFLNTNLPHLRHVNMKAMANRQLRRPISCAVKNPWHVKMDIDPDVMHLNTANFVEYLNAFSSLSLNLCCTNIINLLKSAINHSTMNFPSFQTKELEIFGDNGAENFDFLSDYLALNPTIISLTFRLVFEALTGSTKLLAPLSNSAIKVLFISTLIEENNWAFDFVARALKSCANVTKFSLNLRGDLSLSLNELISCMTKYDVKMNSLQCFSIETTLNASNIVHIFEFASLAPNLTTLEIEISHSDLSSDLLFGRLRALPCLKVQKLKLNLRATINSEFLGIMISKVPDLVSLEVCTTNQGNSNDFVCLASSLSKLRFLTMQLKRTTKLENHLANLLPRLTMLVDARIKISDCSLRLQDILPQNNTFSFE